MARDGGRITAAEMKCWRRTLGYTWTDYKTNTQITKELKITQILDKLLEYKRNWMYVCMLVSKHFLRRPTPRLHRFLSSHWPSFRFLSFMAFFILSIQFFFSLPRAVICFGIYFSAILGNLPSAII
jgi:hypothetical protein